MSDSDDRINALLSVLSYDNVSSEVADALSNVIRKEKEKQVLKLHRYKISGPFVTKKQTIYSTRCPWLPNKKVNRSSYNDIIDYLYDHYFGNSNDMLTVREVYDQMIREYEEERTLKYLTLLHYKDDWDKYVVGKGAEWLNKPIKEVKDSQIYSFYKKITGDGLMRESTFRNVKTVINSVFDYGIIHDIPCIKASLISTNKLTFAAKDDKWAGVYSIEDKKKIWDVCSQIKPTVYTKAIELFFCLDIRISELRALQKDNIDLVNKTVYVGHQMVDDKTDSVNRHPVRVNIMKGHKETGKRTEPLSDRAVNIIRWLIEYNRNSIWLLPNRTGNGPIYTNTFNKNLKKICEKVDIKYFSSHGIRYHVISALFDADISEKKIQYLSGHSNSDMTHHYNKDISDTCEDEKIREVLG